VLGHRAPRREGSQLCRQVHRSSRFSAFRISLLFLHGTSVVDPDPGSDAFLTPGSGALMTAGSGSGEDFFRILDPGSETNISTELSKNLWVKNYFDFLSIGNFFFL
jgi:hypothetical protein